MSTVRSLKLLDIESSCRDVPTYFSSAEQDRSKYLGLEVYNTTLIHVQPTPFFTSCYERAGLHPRRDVHRIAMWYWEYGQIPEEWRSIARDIDEIWWPHALIGDALRKTITLPILDLMPGVDVGEVAPFPRAHSGFHQNIHYSYLSSTWLSLMERKNPLGLIKAFRRAFRRNDKVSLVIKVAHPHFFPQDAARLRAAARQAGVILFPSNPLPARPQRADSDLRLLRLAPSVRGSRADHGRGDAFRQARDRDSVFWQSRVHGPIQLNSH